MRVPAQASASPAAAPSAASSTISVSSWRISRARPAPSELRTPISRRRAAERESSRLARFTHAISRTNPTAAVRVNSAGRILPTAASCRLLMVVSHPELELGNCCSARAAMALRSACAAASEAPALSRPMPLEVMAAALLPVLQVHRQRSPDFRPRRKLKVRRHHADHGVELVVQLHRLAERVAAAGEAPLPESMAQDDDAIRPNCASCAVKARPSEGCGPARRRNRAVTRVPRKRSGSPPPARLNPAPPKAAIPENVWF